MYFQGRGVPKDFKSAMSWFRKAAEQGNAESEYFLGAMCSLGLGAARNAEEALFWYGKASGQGHAAAKAALLEMGKPYDESYSSPSEILKLRPSPLAPTAPSNEEVRRMIQAAAP
jgi:hypothetical protein